MKSAKNIRCAIYTRVSTDQGLEQEFNSLDAQREASEAYIKSQTHEGWSCLKEQYDDGGFSDGSLERPALQRLTEDVRQKKLDVIVVYKVDRLAGFVACAMAATLVAAPWWGSIATERLVGEFMVYLALASLWNLLAGYTGLVSVGQQAFVGIGAYVLISLALLAGWNPLYAVPAAGIAATFIAIPMGMLVFRLHGAYFAIGTWVVAEAIRLFVAQITVLGGGSGVSLPTDIMKMVGETKFWREATIYWLALALGLGTLAIVYSLLRPRLGLALTAIRDNELASESLGVRIERIKFAVCVLGCDASNTRAPEWKIMSASTRIHWLRPMRLWLDERLNYAKKMVGLLQLGNRREICCNSLSSV
jgi:ABC-type uncharacterized transport system permease subunit